MRTKLDYGLADADNHYFEPPDCFTRHMPRATLGDAIRIEKDDSGEYHAYFRDRIIGFTAADLTEVSEPPGAMMSILATDGASRDDAAVKRPHPPENVNRSARLAVMDEQGVDVALFFPSIAVGVEQGLQHDPQAVMANFRSFNRWLEEDWGFGTDGRIIGVPLLSLADRDAAVEELDRVLNAGARVISLRPSHVNGRSPADSYFDAFWSRIHDAGVPVALHLHSGFLDQSQLWGENPDPHHDSLSALQFGFFFADRPIMETLAAMILHNLFGRYPNLKILSLENGAGWVPYFEKSLYKGWRLTPFGPAPWGKVSENPIDVFRRHVWIAPYPEERNTSLVERIGVSHVLMGSDFPHAEGIEWPADFTTSLKGLGPEDTRKVMRDNLLSVLNG